MNRKIEKYKDEVYDIILPHSSYIRDRPGAMHWMNLELIMLFCGNVVVSILVNLASNSIYDRYFKKSEELYSEVKLNQILGEIKEIKKHTVSVENCKINLLDHIQNLGFPEEVTLELKERIELIVNDLSKDVINDEKEERS